MKRINHYRDREFAKKVAESTCGRLLDETFSDDFGDYYIVLWDV